MYAQENSLLFNGYLEMAPGLAQEYWGSAEQHALILGNTGQTLRTFVEIIFDQITPLNAVEAHVDGQWPLFLEEEMYNSCEKNSLCFKGTVNILTDKGKKMLKYLKRGDKVLTNDGYQPLTALVKGLAGKRPGAEKWLVIPKDFFYKNYPNEEIIVTPTHALSIKVVSDKEDKDFEYLHFFASELKMFEEIKLIQTDKYQYGFVFDQQYEVNIGGLKWLSHHPNADKDLSKWSYRLPKGLEINPSNRTKKEYSCAAKGEIYFETITIKQIINDKFNGNDTDKQAIKDYLGKVLKFNY